MQDLKPPPHEAKDYIQIIINVIGSDKALPTNFFENTQEALGSRSV